MSSEIKMTMVQPPECYENDITLTADKNVDDDDYVIDLMVDDHWEYLTIKLTKDRVIELKNWLEGQIDQYDR